MIILKVNESILFCTKRHSDYGENNRPFTYNNTSICTEHTDLYGVGCE